MTFFALNGDYDQISDLESRIEWDRSEYASLLARRKQLFLDFEAVLALADSQIEAMVPLGCQDFEWATTSDQIEYTWGVTNYLYTMQGLDPIRLVAQKWHPKYVTNAVDIDVCCTRIKARLAELQPGHDAAVMQGRLQKAAEAAAGILSPFSPPQESYAYAVGLKGKANDIRDYHVPLGETDLSKLTSGLGNAWNQAQTRLDLLLRHPDLSDPATVGWIKNFGTILTNYQKVLTIDQNERAAAPAQAANMIASYSNILAQWPATAPWSWASEDFESNLSGMAGTIANAQRDLGRARSGFSPAYVLIEGSLPGYIQQLVSKLTSYQAEYTAKSTLMMKQMPVITLGAATLTGALGQPLTNTTTATQPGGTFSSPNLPTGLRIDAATGTITGTPTQAGWQGDVVIAYTGPDGTTAHKILKAQIGAVQVGAISIVRSGGASPTLLFAGQAGAAFKIQTRSLEPEQWWKTVYTSAPVAGVHTWNDPSPPPSGLQFYRVIFAP